MYTPSIAWLLPVSEICPDTIYIDWQICVFPTQLFIFPQIALAIGVLTSNRRGGWLPTLAGFTLGAIAWVPLREKIDQSVTPFSAAPFSTLITHKLIQIGLCYLGSMLV